MSSSGGNKEAIKLQRESLALQKETFAQQTTFMEKQLAALRNAQVPAFKPGSPPPTAATAGVDEARRLALLEASRRFGYADTIRGGMRRGIGSAA